MPQGRWFMVSLMGVAAALSGASVQAAGGEQAQGAGTGTARQVPVSPASQQVGPSVPPFESAFSGYRGYADEPVAPWRESNDQVRQIGGWRAYAREAHAPAAPAPDPDSPPAAPGSASPSAPADMPATGGESRAQP